MTKNGEATTVFDAKRHLTSCFELPTRDPEPYYNLKRKSTTPYFDEFTLLSDHEPEVKKLQAEGVPLYTARVLVLNAYAHTKPTVARRVAEAKKL
jgi:hypothetical protein